MHIVSKSSFKAATEELTSMMKYGGQRVATERWQGMDVRNNPAAVSYELSNVVLTNHLGGNEDLDYFREDTGANLPWADDHFLERVGGEPLNPGEQWKNWPWGKSAARFRDPGERFNHTYAERLWPKYARKTPGGKLPEWDIGEGETGLERRAPPYPSRRYSARMEGIGHEYGDLQDLVDLLVREPYTRQAYIPLFFPEDTGYGDGGRKPCTLGYQFMVRNLHESAREIHMFYPLRSCDLVRHFRDDCYLAVRLLLWVLDRCRAEDPDFWDKVYPGQYVMHMTSLHVFENDRRSL